MLAPTVPAMGPELLNSLTLSGDAELDEQIKKWLLWDKNASTIQQVVDAVKDQDWEALRIRLCNVSTFGTQGLRGPMRAGFDSINDLVSIEVAQGLSNMLIEIYPSVATREAKGVVIGYDGRYNGKRFAQLITTVLLNNRIRVYLFNRIVPTPFVVFAVRYLECLAGVAVTASQNPKTDNGFKIFMTNGAPILTPLDTQLQASVAKNAEPLPTSWNLSVLDDNPLHENPYRVVYAAYFEHMRTLLPYTYLETNECSQLRFIYTPLHGVGYHYIREAFYQARLKPIIPVLEQKDSDPDFPTVSSPSPLDGHALDLAIRKAEEEHCTIILANDGDADRLAVAELDPKGRWKKFTGDEMGALLGWWAVENYKTRTAKPNVGNCFMISSVGTSQVLGAMARIEGFTFVETLIGFKWIANKAMELQKLGKTFLFAFEEAMGFMFSSNIPDKDGVIAACQVATMACYLRSTRNLTLIEKLREIYETYGYYATISRSIEYENVKKIAEACDRIRRFEDGILGTYPKCILNNEFEVRSVRDLTLGVDTSYPDGKPRLMSSPSRQLLSFTFDNGMLITMRSSCSSPTLRINAQLFGLPEQKDWDEIYDTLVRMTDAVINEFITALQ